MSLLIVIGRSFTTGWTGLGWARVHLAAAYDRLLAQCSLLNVPAPSLSFLPRDAFVPSSSLPIFIHFRIVFHLLLSHPISSTFLSAVRSYLWPFLAFAACESQPRPLVSSCLLIRSSISPISSRFNSFLYIFPPVSPFVNFLPVIHSFTHFPLHFSLFIRFLSLFPFFFLFRL